MKPVQTKLQQDVVKEVESEQQQHLGGKSEVREFESVEHLLQHDAERTPLPAGIAQRLRESVGKEPPAAPRSWLRRFLKW
jgi:hypothetical protein